MKHIKNFENLDIFNSKQRKEKNKNEILSKITNFIISKDIVGLKSILTKKNLIFINEKHLYDTQLMIACEYNNFDAAKFLIENGADINKKGHAMFSPISKLVYNGDLNEDGFKIFKLLLSQPNIDLETTSQYNSTPLLLAVEFLKRLDKIEDDDFDSKIHLEIIEILLYKGVNIYAKNHNYKNGIDQSIFDILIEKESSIYSYKYVEEILNIILNFAKRNNNKKLITLTNKYIKIANDTIIRTNSEKYNL